MPRDFFVYIMASKGRTLYIGMTSDLERRVYEHKHKLTPGFTSEYNVTRLVHMEAFSDVHDAIRREKQLKRWSRAKKIALIESANPTWRDLSVVWFKGGSERNHGMSTSPRYLPTKKLRQRGRKTRCSAVSPSVYRVISSLSRDLVLRPEICCGAMRSLDKLEMTVWMVTEDRDWCCTGVFTAACRDLSCFGKGHVTEP